jgi:hypothetical protein
MTRKFETEKYLKKRHLIQQIPTSPDKKMAVFKGNVEHSKEHQEVVKKFEPINAAPSSVNEVDTPTMAVKKEISNEIKPKNKNWRDKLIEKWRKLMNQLRGFFQLLLTHFKRRES